MLNMELNFKFTEKEAQTILNILIKQPYEIVYEIVNKIQVQANEQIVKTKIDEKKE